MVYYFGTDFIIIFFTADLTIQYMRYQLIGTKLRYTKTNNYPMFIIKTIFSRLAKYH